MSSMVLLRSVVIPAARGIRALAFSSKSNASASKSQNGPIAASVGNSRLRTGLSQKLQRQCKSSTAVVSDIDYLDDSDDDCSASTSSKACDHGQHDQHYQQVPESEWKAKPKLAWTSNAKNVNVDDLTFSREKSGTPSPWALFDAWGAGAHVIDPISPEESAMLDGAAVKIAMSEEERAQLPNETDVLCAYDKYLQSQSSVHMGYPYNLQYNHSELYSFMKYSINNLGDPFVPSNYGVHSRQFECAVIDFFARLWKMKPDSYWGYVTTSGTEGNLHGILLSRECHPDGILYTSNETHYSVFKAARYYRMDCHSISTSPTGEIDYDILAQDIEKNRDRPVIINVNIGTTVKGAVDDLDRILGILQMLDIPRHRYHIHCDGALFALMMPFLEDAPEISFCKPIDSIAVSGHKMLGSPMPCGIALCRKEHVQKVEQHIDYLNSVDTTIMGSRNGQAALYLWYGLRKKGIMGIKQDVVHCMETAVYLRDKLTNAGFSCRLNRLSSTVVLERPVDSKLIQRWQLACENDIAHVVVMPNVTRSKIDLFVNEFIESSKKFGRIQPQGPDSSLSGLFCSSWGEHTIAS